MNPTQNLLSGGYVLPPGCSWQPQIINNKKEGTVEVFDADNILIALLNFKNDMLNGTCQFFKDGMIIREIPYCDDIAYGIGY